MLNKELAHNPLFIKLARQLSLIAEEKASLAADLAVSLQILDFRASQAIDDFNLQYRESQLNCGDG
jgi:hypothetical protein